MAEKRIELSRPYTVLGVEVSAVTIKEPTGYLLLQHGEPAEIARGSGGEAIIVENLPAIRGYLDACCVPGAEILSQLGVEDMRRAKMALMGFFRSGGEEKDRPAPSTSSSSGLGEASPNSAP